MKHVVLAALMALMSAQAPDTARGGPFVRVRMPDASNVADGFSRLEPMDAAKRAGRHG
jgi:hypothetical protein